MGFCLWIGRNVNSKRFGNLFQSDFIIEKGDVKPNKFLISHMGIINSLRNPKVLWQSLSELCGEIPTLENDLEIRLIGTVDPGLVNEIIAK